MHRVHSAGLLALSLMACHSVPSTQPARDDAAIGGSADAASSRGTEVVGTLDGTSFDLRYGAAKHASNTDPRNWICASDVVVTFDQCQQAGGVPRTMLVGPFVYNAQGSAKWDLSELWLFRIGGNAESKNAISGTINVLTDDSATGSINVTMSVSFGDTSPVTGSVVINN